MSMVMAPVLGLAVIDSINPSALVVALWWLAQPGAAPRLLAYIAGIAVSYLALGIAMMLGAGAALRHWGDALDHPLALAVQLAIGLTLLGYGIFAPKVSADADRPPPQPRIGGLLGMAVLGAMVTTIELSTALPYFAAIALMTSAKLTAWQWLPLLLVYNAIFIAPPMLLLGLHLMAGQRMRGRFEHWRGRLQRGAREAMLWVIAIAGVALAGDAASRFMADRGERDGNAESALHILQKGRIGR